MKLCRFDANRLGLVRDGRVYDVTWALRDLPARPWPYPQHDVVIEHLDAVTAQIAAAPLPDESVAVEKVSLLCPVGNFSKIVAAPVNYRAHVDESEADAEIHANRTVLKIGDAGLFLKANSSVNGPAAGIDLHFPDRRTDHEVELAVVIGKRCKNVSEEDALDVVAGYCIGLDITVRGIEDRSFRKSIDSYTVVGPWLTTRDEIADPDRLKLELRVSGTQRQDANTAQLIYGVRQLIAWASTWYALLPGDIILTGTPEGVGPIAAGDTIDASIEGLGSIRVAVRADAAAPYARAVAGAAN